MSCCNHTNITQVLIFANSPDEGMRLRLFLESFGLRLALLSPDQPLNSRCVWGTRSADGDTCTFVQAYATPHTHSTQNVQYAYTLLD